MRAFNFAKKPSKFKKSIALWASIGIGILLICVLSFFVIWHQLFAALNADNEEKIFIVEEGRGLETIAKNLEAQNIIRSKWGFIFNVWLHGQTKNLKAGNYQLNSAMSINEIVNKIIKGDVVPQGIKVTIPEGFSNGQIKERLVSLGIISEGESFPQELEGYLFPDTYYFEKDTPVENVVKKMQDNFNKKITEDLKTEIERQNKNLSDILIMASILEKEVISDEDRAIVAGIFWKRLENNYPLESCATIAYILGVDKWRYSIEDTKIESPYNTYTNIGLPPTPINNPGISAIRAAIYPQETDYYFFLTDPETGNTIFSKTFQEHNANKQKYFK